MVKSKLNLEKKKKKKWTSDDGSDIYSFPSHNFNCTQKKKKMPLKEVWSQTQNNKINGSHSSR